MTEFGELLREFRGQAGISLGELARKINYSKGQVSKIENGHAKPNLAFAKLCDNQLGTGGALTAAVRALPQPAESSSPDDVWVLEMDEIGALRFAELPRRQALAGAGALLGSAVTNSSRSEIDDRTFAVLRESFDQHRVLGTMTSPSLVLAQVIALVHTLRTLAIDNPRPMETELRTLAARVAEYAGWMSQEAGSDTDALRWTDRAVAFDPKLASFALYRHAEIALYRQDPAHTIELAQRAQQDRATRPRVIGLAARCEAQGHALAGDATAFEKAWERAVELLATRDQDTGPVLGPASAPDDMPLVRGWSLFELGRPGDAAELLDQHLPSIPPTARRARARFGVRRALAHAANGEVEQSCIATGEVLADVAQVDSATIRKDLRDLNRTLNRWHTRRAVGELQLKLVPLLR